MKAQHTPGPWQHHPIGNLYFVPQRDFSVICNVGINHTVGCVISETDANLIAAAPDLLAALEKCVKLFDQHDDCRNVDATASARHSARAAIAKARGE